MKKISAILLGTLILFACSSRTNNDELAKSDSLNKAVKLAFETDSTLPKSRTLSEFKNTTFLTTLESNIDISKNNIYAASLLLAWNEMKNTIEDSIQKFESIELQQINNSKSYWNTLRREEYTSNIKIKGDTIDSYAYFRKALPFSIPLEKDKTPFIFLKDTVSSFSFDGERFTSSIIYYNNDDDFAIKIYPKDSEHEIILIKAAFSKQTSFATEFKKMNTTSNELKKTQDHLNSWKFFYEDKDTVRIPIIEFNIENNYKNIEGSEFSTNNNSYLMQTVYQRTAFTLNEKGAIVESEAEMAAVAAAHGMNIPKPKKLFFDKPFIIFLKRKDNPNPYFAMYIRNSELMKKVK